MLPIAATESAPSASWAGRSGVSWRLQAVWLMWLVIQGGSVSSGKFGVSICLIIGSGSGQSVGLVGAAGAL